MGEKRKTLSTYEKSDWYKYVNTEQIYHYNTMLNFLKPTGTSWPAHNQNLQLKVGGALTRTGLG